jgi:copper resistance protein C
VAKASRIELVTRGQPVCARDFLPANEWERPMRWMIVALLITAGASAARAHASLTRASPPEGSVATTSPHEIALTFTDTLEPAFSKITVTDASGAEVTAGKVQVNGNAMRVELKPLSAGVFRSWRCCTSWAATSEARCRDTNDRKNRNGSPASDPSGVAADARCRPLR